MVPTALGDHRLLQGVAGPRHNHIPMDGLMKKQRHNAKWMLSIRKVSDSPLGSSPLGSDGPLGPSPLGSVGVLGPNLREHSHSESMAMMIITMISTRIDTQKRMGGDTALWLKAFVEVKK